MYSLPRYCLGNESCAIIIPFYYYYLRGKGEEIWE